MGDLVLVHGEPDPQGGAGDLDVGGVGAGPSPLGLPERLDRVLFDLDVDPAGGVDLGMASRAFVSAVTGVLIRQRGGWRTAPTGPPEARACVTCQTREVRAGIRTRVTSANSSSHRTATGGRRFRGSTPR